MTVINQVLFLIEKRQNVIHRATRKYSDIFLSLSGMVCHTYLLEPCLILPALCMETTAKAE